MIIWQPTEELKQLEGSAEKYLAKVDSHLPLPTYEFIHWGPFYSYTPDGEYLEEYGWVTWDHSLNGDATVAYENILEFTTL